MSAGSTGFFGGALIDMGLDGVRRSPWSSFGGVDGLDDDTSIIVGVDVDSEGLREVILFVSENVPPAGL